MTSNREIRREARPIFRENFLCICGMLALTELIAVGILAAFTAAMNLLLLSFSARLRLLASSRALLEALPVIVPALYLLLLALIGWLTCGLHLGLCHGLIGLTRGAGLHFSALFSRMRQGFKGLGLLLLVGLKMFLWTIPASVLWSELTILYENFRLPDSFLLWGNLICCALQLALTIPCMLRHALSLHILADNPESGIRTAAARSKHLLRYWKFQFFRLCLPDWLGFGAAMLVIYALGSYALPQIAEAGSRQALLILSSVLTFLLSALCSAKVLTVQTVFYERSLS